MEPENLPKELVPFVENHRFVCLCNNPMIKNNYESNETFFRAKGDAVCGAIIIWKSSGQLVLSRWGSMELPKGRFEDM